MKTTKKFYKTIIAMVLISMIQTMFPLGVKAVVTDGSSTPIALSCATAAATVGKVIKTTEYDSGTAKEGDLLDITFTLGISACSTIAINSSGKATSTSPAVPLDTNGFLVNSWIPAGTYRIKYTGGQFVFQEKVVEQRSPQTITGLSCTTTIDSAIKTITFSDYSTQNAVVGDVLEINFTKGISKVTRISVAASSGVYTQVPVYAHDGLTSGLVYPSGIYRLVYDGKKFILAGFADSRAPATISGLQCTTAAGTTGKLIKTEAYTSAQPVTGDVVDVEFAQGITALGTIDINSTGKTSVATKLKLIDVSGATSGLYYPAGIYRLVFDGYQYVLTERVYADRSPVEISLTCSTAASTGIKCISSSEYDSASPVIGDRLNITFTKGITAITHICVNSAGTSNASNKIIADLGNGTTSALQLSAEKTYPFVYDGYKFTYEPQIPARVKDTPIYVLNYSESTGGNVGAGGSYQTRNDTYYTEPINLASAGKIVLSLTELTGWNSKNDTWCCDLSEDITMYDANGTKVVSYTLTGNICRTVSYEVDPNDYKDYDLSSVYFKLHFTHKAKNEWYTEVWEPHGYEYNVDGTKAYRTHSARITISYPPKNFKAYYGTIPVDNMYYGESEVNTVK